MAQQEGKISVEIDYRGSTTLIFLRRPTRWLAVFPMLFMFVLVIGGGIFATGVATDALEGEPMLTFMFLSVWILAVVTIMAVSIFHVFGREYLIAHANELVHVYRIFGVDWPNAIAAKMIKRLQFVADNPRHKIKVNGTVIPQSALCIHRDGPDLYIAIGISRHEADRAIAAILERIYIRHDRRDQEASSA